MLSLGALIRSLKTYDIKLNEVFEENNRKCKSIALKSIQRRSNSFEAMKASKETDEEEEPSNDEDEEKKDKIAHLAKKISKAWIRRIKKKEVTPKKDKKGKTKQNEIICHVCKELRHLRSECPKLKKSSRKKAHKKKTMIATWEDLDEKQEGTKSQEEEIVANLCFMVDIVFDEETEVMDSEPAPSYDDL